MYELTVLILTVTSLVLTVAGLYTILTVACWVLSALQHPKGEK